MPHCGCSALHGVNHNLKKAISETYFTFNSSIFESDWWCSNGFLIGACSNHFVYGFHEQNWIEQATNVKSIFYKRYVDDIFAIFESESDADAFYSYFDTKHENIKITFEKNRKIRNLPF